MSRSRSSTTADPGTTSQVRTPGSSQTPTLSVSEIASITNVNDATVRVWINTKKLPAYKLPGSGAQAIIRVRRDDFEQFLARYKA